MNRYWNMGLAIAACVMLLSSPAFAAVVQTADGPAVVKTLGYQLQGPDAAGGELTVGPLAAAAHDLLVIDFARFGEVDNKFSPAEISSIKNSSQALGGDGSRKVTTAYVSIGEASEFRSYWNAAWTQNGQANSPLTATAPSWLGPVNPDFPESRKVRYWETAWQDEIFNAAGTGWLDQVVTQGFDGAYLDIIDAYFFWGEEALPADKLPGDPVDSTEAARRMIDFVVGMTTHARQTNPHFFVIPQNGEFILADLADDPTPEPGDAARRTAYLQASGAIGIEDTYFRGDLDENNGLNPDQEKIQILKDDFLANGVPVLVTDYINDAAKVDQFHAAARADGFIPYAAFSRGLDQLNPAAPGVVLSDFDSNGAVDGADFLRWQRGLGTTPATLLAGNADGDSDVDGDDLLHWQAEFGTTAGGSQLLAIPEPATMGLAGFAFAFGIGRKWYRCPW